MPITDKHQYLVPPDWASLHLLPIYWNHIVFAHDLCHSQSKYFRNAIDL